MFRTTGQAINYGLLASAKDQKRLAALRNEFIGQTKEAIDREQFDLASVFATQAQFCREALEAKTLNAKVAEMFCKARINDGTQASVAQ
jgi:hypothetical protein